MSEQPLVSVIVPVYNGKEYLRECLDSVLAQTYQNWELVVLDNFSSDGSTEIIAEYVARDSRVRVHRNEALLPLVHNHNASLRLMSPTARYCKMLMADDYLMPDCVAKMVGAAEAHPTVGLVCTLSIDGRNVWWDGWPYPARRVPGREVARAHLFDLNFYIFGSPTSCLYRADLVRRRPEFFNPLSNAADYESCLDMLAESDFAFVHQILTFHRLHEGSVTSSFSEMDGAFVGRLYTLIRTGPTFLTPEEYEARRDWAIRTYYGLLARRALGFPGAKFWAYHRTFLQKMGEDFNRARLAMAICKRLVRRVLNPLSWRLPQLGATRR
jgi:glycosyltransferase involved in cell wall biosynthesis